MSHRGIPFKLLSYYAIKLYKLEFILCCVLLAVVAV